MPIPALNKLPPEPSFNDLVNKLNSLVGEMTNLLLNLDDVNFDEITANVIAAHTITADKMNVNQLSSISANLGHIVAGLIESVQIFGSYIATRMSGYPKCEMSNTENLFGAYGAADRHIKMFANGMIGNTPVLQFTQGNSFATQAQTGGAFYFQTSGEMKFQGSDIDLYGNVKVNGGGSLGLYGQPLSSASDVSQVVSDLNTLLINLKAMKVIA